MSEEQIKIEIAVLKEKLSNIESKLEDVISNHLFHLTEDIKNILLQLESLKPVKKFFYGLIGTVLLAILSAILFLIIK